MFGEQLKKLRKLRGISQYDLADRLGFTRGQIANYEQGKRQPDFETLQKIADFFEVSIDDLLGRKINPDYELSKQKTEFIVKEIVKKYDLDLTEEGIKEKLEAIIKLVIDDYKKKN
jgi:transcriptional regulator with XRE-family HTH domain